MKKTSILALTFLMGLLIAFPSAAQAAPRPGSFGQHVSACAQTMGLGAEMNPGMHHGAHGWDGMTC